MLNFMAIVYDIVFNSAVQICNMLYKIYMLNKMSDIIYKISNMLNRYLICQLRYMYIIYPEYKISYM